MICIFVDAPNHFTPKAEFAIESMLSVYDCPFYFVKQATDFRKSDHVKLYYGSNSELIEATDVHLFSSEVAFEYFSSREVFNEELCMMIETEYGENLPVLFHKSDSQFDLVASAFYFLSDWEKALPTSRDAHRRVLYKNTLAGKLGIANRPVVNEFTGIIVGEIRDRTNLEIQRRQWGGRDFAAVITHDIDRIRKKYAGTVKRELYDIPLKNAHNLPVRKRIKRMTGSAKDLLTPGDTYETSILKSFEFEKELGVTPTFLFKSIINKHKNDAADYLSNPFFETIVSNLVEMNAEIGLHASYEAGFDAQLFSKEKKQLENKLHRVVESHRYHYVRYDHTFGFRILWHGGIKTDSSIGWAEMAGFRTGFTHPHYIFDIELNQKIPVLQLPMMLMDMQLFHYMGLSEKEAVQYAKQQVDIVRRYGGVVVWNFHHLIYDDVEAPGCAQLFEKGLRYLHKKNSLFITMKECYDYYTKTL